MHNRNLRRESGREKNERQPLRRFSEIVRFLPKRLPSNA